MANRLLLPVQLSGDEERTRRIWVVKSWMSWGWEEGSGVDDKPRPNRSGFSSQLLTLVVRDGVYNGVFVQK